MKTPFFLSALLLCAGPTLAQTVADKNAELPFPTITPQAAETLVRGDKTLVFHLRDVTLGEALRELQAQSGFVYQTKYNENLAPLDKKLSLDLETRSISEAFRAMLDEAGVRASTWMQKADEWAVSFGQQQPFDGAPQSGFGPFQMQLRTLSSSVYKFVALTNGPYTRAVNDGTLQISFDALSEPLVEVSATRFRLTRAEDEAGRSLIYVPAKSQFAGGAPPEIWSNYPAFRLAKPAQGASKLARIEGIANYVLPTKRETWQVPDLLGAPDAAHEFKSGGQTVRVRIKSARLNNQKDLELEIAVTLLSKGGFGGLANPLFSSTQLLNALRIEDARGHLFAMTHAGATGSSPEMNMHATMELPDDKTAVVEPLKLTLNAPVEFVQTEVPFSFADVPLP